MFSFYHHVVRGFGYLSALTPQDDLLSWIATKRQRERLNSSVGTAISQSNNKNGEDRGGVAVDGSANESASICTARERTFQEHSATLVNSHNRNAILVQSQNMMNPSSNVSRQSYYKRRHAEPKVSPPDSGVLADSLEGEAPTTVNVRNRAVAKDQEWVEGTPLAE
jgi:hypothetical protein